MKANLPISHASQDSSNTSLTLQGDLNLPIPVIEPPSCRELYLDKLLRYFDT